MPRMAGTLPLERGVGWMRPAITIVGKVTMQMSVAHLPNKMMVIILLARPI